METGSKPLRVLFMQSQTYFGADSRIHALLMQYLDPNQVEVHAAVNYGDGNQKSAAAAALERIDQLQIRPTHFGASFHESSRAHKLKMALLAGLPAFISLVGLLGYIRKHQIQIIHCTEKPRDAFFGYLLARLSGAKCLIHLHVKAESWIDRKVQWAMQRADLLLGVSQFVAESIVAMGFPAEKTSFVYNSLSLDGWDPNLDGSKIRQEFQIAADEALMLVVSRLFSWKGHTELLKALAVLKKTTPKFKLLVVGEDDPRAHPGHGSYSDELKALVLKLDLAKNVIFTGFRSDIPQLMAACDIYSMPSFEEPFGMVFLEAMAMKKPVVALDNGGSREIIQHGESGLLSLPNDINQMADHLRILIENPALRQQMGECGRRVVEERFTPLQMSTNVLKMYRQILAKEALLPVAN